MWSSVADENPEQDKKREFDRERSCPRGRHKDLDIGVGDEEILHLLEGKRDTPLRHIQRFDKEDLLTDPIQRGSSDNKTQTAENEKAIVQEKTKTS